MAQQYFYDKQIRRYIQQFIRLFSGFSVQMGINDDKLPIYQTVPVRYGDINRMAAHITRENSENIVNTVPFISCYVGELALVPERRIDPSAATKVQVYEKKFDETTNKYVDEVGSKYEIERHMPVPYDLVMQCDIWSSNTEQKLQLLEQIMVLFNPTLNIRSSNSPFDWSALTYVEMTNTIWSSRSVGSNIDDIIDVATLTFKMPIYINPPAKVKHQNLIHTIINQSYTLDEADLDHFKAGVPFDKTTLEYTVVTYEDKMIKFEDNKAYLLNLKGTNLDSSGNILNWKTELLPFGELRDGISQIRLRKGTNPGDKDNDIIGRVSYNVSDTNVLDVIVDSTTLPSTTLTAIDGIVNPTANYPGDGTVPTAATGDRYMITENLPISTNWSNLTANKNDIIEYNGSAWVVSFNSNSDSTHQYVTNVAASDQLEWTGSEWINSFEGTYNAGFWRLYL